MPTSEVSLITPRTAWVAMVSTSLLTREDVAEAQQRPERRPREARRRLWASETVGGGRSVRQHVRSVVVEVQPKSAEVLRELILRLRENEERTTPQYQRLKEKMPALHFMSMTVFKDAHYDPIFVIEVNFDGAPGPFWAQLEAAIGPELRGMLRCCEMPSDAMAPHRPLAPLLEARAVRPAVHHLGNRGLARERIVRQADLFFAAQQELGDGKHFQGLDPAAVHHRLRAALLPSFPWLEQAPPTRIPRRERVADGLRLAGFVALALVSLLAPGLAVALLLPTSGALWVSALAALALAARLEWLRELRDELGPLPRPRIGALAGLAVALAVYLALLSAAGGAALAVLAGRAFGGAFWSCTLFFALGLAGVPATVLALLLWLRRLERRDPSQDAPPVDEEALRAMARREDRVVQNHMGSVVLLKPGVLRAVLVRAGLWGLGLILRLTATDGYLGSMRTIHFAHWALISNGSRLMFFSNFDGSWESYLDDFIEKARRGLTLAWGSGVGFPPSRYLVLGGASQGRQFKAWARHSMAESLFWFSAYEHLTVNQIERHAIVAEGLCRPTLTSEEAATWTRYL